MAKGLHDKFAGLRITTIEKLATSPYKNDPVVLSDIEEIAKTDKSKKAQAAAIKFLVKTGNAKYLSLYQANVNDSSYSVAGAALEGLAALDSANAYSLAKKYSADAKGALGNAVNKILINNGTEADFDFIAQSYNTAPPSFEKLSMTKKFGDYLLKVNDPAKIKKGIDYIMKFRNIIPEAFRGQTDPAFKSAFDKLSKAKGAEIDAYIKSVFK